MKLGEIKLEARLRSFAYSAGNHTNSVKKIEMVYYCECRNVDSADSAHVYILTQSSPLHYPIA